MMIAQLDQTGHIYEFYMGSLVDFDNVTATNPSLVFVDWPAFQFTSMSDFFQSPKTYVYDTKQKLMLKDSSM